ncbi:glycosyltransferase [Patescibacteria group bacterium]
MIQQLNRIIKNNGLEGRVFFTGYLESKHKYYLSRNALAMVHLPENECYGSAACEAMAAGAITVVSRGTAMEDLVCRGECGIAVDPKSEDEIANAINSIISKDNSELEAMKAKARQKVKDHTWQKVSSSLKTLFQVPEKLQKLTVKNKIKIKPFFKEFPINEKKIFATVIILSLIILVLGVRGYAGTPNITELDSEKWVEYGPFELSPERGKYALVYSIVEDQSLTYSPDLARFTSPDVAINDNGEYVSLFPPGVSILLIPGYLLGRILGAGQIGTTLVIIFFALTNMILIRSIAIRLGANKLAASLGGLVYLFATPAFAYAVSIYQHHITTFLILLSVYIILRWNNLWSIAGLMFICAVSIIIDNPNLFLLFPIGLVAFLRIINIKSSNNEIWMNFRPLGILALLIVIPPLMLFGWYNAETNLSPFKLSGTLEGVSDVDAQGNPVQIDNNDNADKNQSEEKQAWNFFETRNLLNGFYIFTISPDRGVIWYAPIILFGFLGLYYLYQRKPKIANLLFGIMGMNFLLYSMWPDPYGGWAFGPRYMIPAFALLAIGIGVAAPKIKRNYILSIIFILIFGFSVWVNALGAITSNANPPEMEVLALEEVTEKEQKYTYERNLQYMEEYGLKSFVYNSGANKIMEPKTYHNIITGIIILMGMIMFVLIPKSIKNKKHV